METQRRTLRDVGLEEVGAALQERLLAGVLVSTRSGEEFDTMVMGWGMLGTVWERHALIAFVRESRHTFELMDANPEFTVSVPDGRLPSEFVRVAGHESGRDVDKAARLGLTLVEPRVVSVPAIAEVPLTLECRLLARQPLDPARLPAEVLGRFYDPSRPGADPSAASMHVACVGEVVASYVVEA